MPNRPTLHRNSNNLLPQLLEEPNLDLLVRELRGPEWKALIQEVGLEDSSELLALSTPEQLVELIDETLWTNDETESFDLERFVTLLEVLHEAGSRELAERVAGLPDEFLLLAFSRLLSVWPTEFLRELAELDESGSLEKRLESQLSEDIEEYTLLSPNGLAWDALQELFTTWGDSRPELLQRILSRLSAINVGTLGEPDELATVLDEMAELEEDAQGVREDRRARSGYVSASDARAFLRLPPAEKPWEKDAISSAYFRRLRPEPSPPEGSGRARLLDILRNKRPDAKPAARRLASGGKLLRAALDALSQTSPARHARALEELAFLSNVVFTDSARRDEGEVDAVAAMRSVVATIEATGVGLVGLDPEVATERLREQLNRWGPIALFRKRSR